LKNAITILISLQEKLSNNRGMLFEKTVSDELNYMNSLKWPTDDFERSFNQYKCQFFINNSKFLKIVYEIGAAVVVLPLSLFFFFQHFTLKVEENKYATMAKDYFALNLMPIDLKNEINKSYAVIEFKRGSLNIKDIPFLAVIFKRYYYRPLFVLKCIIRVASYSKMIDMYHPKVICASCEYSCASSVLTAYCEHKGIEHINIMHGEKLLTIRDSFTHFDKFYVWDDCYTELFLQLNGDETEYRVFKPFIPVFKNEGPGVIKYYLQLHTAEQLSIIKSCLERIGEPYLVRPHPYHYDEIVRKSFPEELIENPDAVSLWDSLKDAKQIVTVNSTVALQAFWCEIPVVLDDVSNPTLFSELENRQYIMTKKPHKLLSQVIAG